MSITNGYATLNDYRQYQDIDSADQADDTVIELMIESASRYIDGQTGRKFYARTETRYFDVPSGRELRFDDDLISITTLTNGEGTEIGSDEYNFIPRNTTPYYGLKLKEASTYYWLPDSDSNYEGVISIAGSWGWASAVPADIKSATLEIAQTAYRRRSGQNTEGVARVTAAGVVLSPRDIPAYAMAVIAKYRQML